MREWNGVVKPQAIKELLRAGDLAMSLEIGARYGRAEESSELWWVSVGWPHSRTRLCAPYLLLRHLQAMGLSVAQFSSAVNTTVCILLINCGFR